MYGYIAQPLVISLYWLHSDSYIDIFYINDLCLYLFIKYDYIIFFSTFIFILYKNNIL